MESLAGRARRHRRRAGRSAGCGRKPAWPGSADGDARAALVLLSGLAAVIVLDARGYSFRPPAGAGRLADRGRDRPGALAVYRALARAIDRGRRPVGAAPSPRSRARARPRRWPGPPWPDPGYRTSASSPPAAGGEPTNRRAPCAGRRTSPPSFADSPAARSPPWGFLAIAWLWELDLASSGSCSTSRCGSSTTRRR